MAYFPAKKLGIIVGPDCPKPAVVTLLSLYIISISRVRSFVSSSPTRTTYDPLSLRKYDPPKPIVRFRMILELFRRPMPAPHRSMDPVPLARFVRARAAERRSSHDQGCIMSGGTMLASLNKSLLYRMMSDSKRIGTPLTLPFDRRTDDQATSCTSFLRSSDSRGARSSKYPLTAKSMIAEDS